MKRLLFIKLLFEVMQAAGLLVIIVLLIKLLMMAFPHIDTMAEMILNRLAT